MYNVYIKDGALYRFVYGSSDPEYFGYFTGGAPIVVHYEGNEWPGDVTLYPVSDGEFTFYVSKFELGGQYVYRQWYSPEDTGNGWEPGVKVVVQLHIKKYGRDGKVLSSVFPGVSYDGESVTYNPTREPYSVGEYSGETWMEYFSAYTEYLPTDAVDGFHAYGAYVTSLDNPSVKNPSAVPGNEDWHFIFPEDLGNVAGPVFYIPKGTKKVIFTYPAESPVA